MPSAARLRYEGDDRRECSVDRFTLTAVSIVDSVAIKSINVFLSTTERETSKRA